MRMISRYGNWTLVQSVRGRAIVQPASNIVHNPIETRNEIISCYGAAGPYDPVVGVY
jgi:hypothetical protein